MKTIFTLIALSFIVILGYSQQKVEQKIEKLFYNETENKAVHHAFFQIYSDSLQLDAHWESGVFQSGDSVSIRNPFHSASIGKTFTATLIMLLQEQNQLQTHHFIHQYLPAKIIDSLHVFEGTDYSQQITIAQLLQHQSGLPDYFEDTPKTGAPIIEQFLTDTAKFWTPIELVNFSKNQQTPHFPPGKGYHYSDTEYILLGLIIEQITGKELHQVLHEYILEPLGMVHTSMHLRSIPQQATSKMAELYADQINVSGFTSLSLDWAGGGLLTTTHDLLLFHKALIENRLLTAQSWQQMQQWVKASKGMKYGFGLYKIELKDLFFTLPDVSLIGHSGSTGSFLYYCPEWDIYLAGSFNQLSYQKKHVVFLAKTLATIKKEMKL